jgi:hypothetical protein
LSKIGIKCFSETWELEHFFEEVGYGKKFPPFKILAQNVQKLIQKQNIKLPEARKAMAAFQKGKKPNHNPLQSMTIHKLGGFTLRVLSSGLAQKSFRLLNFMLKSTTLKIKKLFQQQ